MLYEKPEMEIVEFEHNIYMALSLGDVTEEDNPKNPSIAPF